MRNNIVDKEDGGIGGDVVSDDQMMKNLVSGMQTSTKKSRKSAKNNESIDDTKGLFADAKVNDESGNLQKLDDVTSPVTPDPAAEQN